MKARLRLARSPWRLLLLLLCAAAVIAGMLAVADHARHDVDRARRSQLLMEQVRSSTIRVEAVTWESLATSEARSAPDPALIAAGLAAFREVTASLRALHRLGENGPSEHAVEVRVGQAYGAGLPALIASRTDPARARSIARTQFTPAMTRLDAALDVASRHQTDVARAGLRRASLAFTGSLLIGLALLALLGWRVHRMRGVAAVTAHARDAERRGEERLRALVRHSSDIVAVLDAEGNVRWIAESAERWLGYDPVALIGHPLDELIHPDDRHRGLRLLQRVIEHPFQTERESLRVTSAAGDYRHLELVAENRIADPLVEGVLLNLRDVTQRIALEDQLRHQAFHDALTGLPNRTLFEDRLAQALARRHGGAVTVLFIDIDDFKTVNDSLGHAVGDRLLEAVAGRLRATLRPEDTASRFGGDEFAVLIEDLDGADGADAVAERLRRALEPAVDVGDRTLPIIASIGIACASGDDSPEDVLRNADVAMYSAKARGKGRVVRFEPSMHARALERLELVRDLDTALERGELSLVYQPLVNLSTGAMKGVEALLRWNHPVRGTIGPDRFIPLAESTGSIIPIGEWVLRTACEQLRAWPGAEALELAVNVSARQLADPQFPNVVRRALADAGVAAGRVTLEITEGMLTDDGEHMLSQLHALKRCGVRLAIDDFGTGYSALSYLRSFPVDVLKIDRSFMPGIVGDEEKTKLVRGIVEMGRSLELEIVTEGIEEISQAVLMQELRSDSGQGYVFSPPVNPSAIEDFLASGLPLHTVTHA